MMNISLSPEGQPEIVSENTKGRGQLTLMPCFSGDAFKQAVNYPIIVEMWEKKTAGRIKNAYLAAFTKTERNTLTKWYGRFYRWYLVSGTPKRVMLRLKTLELLQKAVHFFATV